MPLGLPHPNQISKNTLFTLIKYTIHLIYLSMVICENMNRIWVFYKVGDGIKGRINVGLVLIGIRSVFGIAYKYPSVPFP